MAHVILRNGALGKAFEFGFWVTCGDSDGWKLEAERGGCCDNDGGK
jgi:hypothetical protein